MHNSPQPQYIIYLEEEVGITTSSGETRRLKSGDRLFATDSPGEGHISKTSTKGRSIIVTINNLMDKLILTISFCLHNNAQNFIFIIQTS